MLYIKTERAIYTPTFQWAKIYRCHKYINASNYIVITMENVNFYYDDK